MFVPTAGATTGSHRDCLFVASFAQQSEIQCLVFRGQIISGDLPSQTHAHMHNYNLSIMMNMAEAARYLLTI